MIRLGDGSPRSSENRLSSERKAEVAAGREWAGIFRELSEKDRRDEMRAAELERLAEAAYMLGSEDEFVSALERAFDRHLEKDRAQAAARCSFWIGLTLMFRGEFGRGNGWLARADRVLEALPADCAEHGYLLLPKVEQCLAAGDRETAYAHAARAAEIGVQCKDDDLAAMARHLQGRIRITAGDYESGMAFLDEAMLSVTSNQLSPIATGLVYCSVIDICQKHFATDRAREWTFALAHWCGKQADLVAFTGRCMIHRAEILIFDGHWDEAGREAGAASARLQQSLAKHHAGPAVYQQGEIFRLRGLFDEADAAYRVASGLGFDPQPGLALLRLRQGRGQPALSAIRRALQSVEDVPGRLRLLPAAVEITLAVGSTEDAQALCDTLQDCAQQCPSELVRAVAAEAIARVRLHQGQAGEALAHVRRAADLLREIRAPYHLARVRVLAAQIFLATGDVEGARNELGAAIERFHDLGAFPDEAYARKLRVSLASSRDGGLTRRQIEILRLIATGKTNPEIAAELGLSHRTVDRHVSDILTRLDVPTRAAATAHALLQGLIDAGGPG